MDCKHCRSKSRTFQLTMHTDKSAAIHVSLSRNAWMLGQRSRAVNSRLETAVSSLITCGAAVLAGFGTAVEHVRLRINQDTLITAAVTPDELHFMPLLAEPFDNRFRDT